jgi:hypothetical protein
MPDAIQRFLNLSEWYGYWNAGGEENAQVGFELPAAAVIVAYVLLDFAHSARS